MTLALSFQAGGDLISSVSGGMEREMVYHVYIGSVSFFAINKSIPIIVRFL